MLLHPLMILALAGLSADQPDAKTPPTTEAPDVDASSAPELEVPALDGEVLGDDPAKNLDSLNPPPPSPPPETETESAPSPAPKAAPPTEEPEFRYADPNAAQEPLRWGDTSTSQDQAFRYAPDKAQPDTLPFAPDAPGAAIDDPGANDNPLRRVYQAPQPSRQRFAMHFKMGPYLPMIDKDDPNGPYAKIFGEIDPANQVTKAPKEELIYWLGFDWQFYQLAGPLSVGLDVGYFTDTQVARVSEDLSRVSEADENRFSFVPLALLLGYRFSYLADKTPVPLVPYLRAGLSYNFWWAQRGSGQLVRDAQDEKVRGGMMGWQGQAGLALRLDGIFRRAGRRMDARFGINHVSLFGEFSTAKSSFDNKKINVGDHTFYGGLLIEF